MLAICAIVFVVMLCAWHLLLTRREAFSKVDGVLVSRLDQKRFAGFWVAVDKQTHEVCVVAGNFSDVYEESLDLPDYIPQVNFVELPGERNEILHRLVVNDGTINRKANHAE